MLQPTAEPRPPSARSLVWRCVWLVGLAVLVVVAISKLPALGSLRSRIGHARAGWIAGMVLLELGSAACFVVALHRAFTGRLRRRTSIAVGLTAQAVNVVVPAGGTGGLAVAAVILNGAGVPAAIAGSRMVALFLLTSVATNVLLIVSGGIGVATGLLSADASLALALVPVLITIAVVLVLAWLDRRLAGVDTRRWHAVPRAATGYLRDGLRSSWELVHRGDTLLVLGSLGFVLCDLGVLSCAFAAVGSSGLPLGTMLLAYPLGQIGSVVSLPGATEGGLVGVFVLYGVSLPLAVSAVLVYRAADTVVPLLLGMIGVTSLRRAQAEPLDATAGR